MIEWTKKEIMQIVIKLLNDFIIDEKPLIMNDKDYGLKEYVRSNICSKKDLINHDIDSTYAMVNNIIYEMRKNGLSNVLTQYKGSKNSDITTQEVVQYFRDIFDVLNN